MKRREDNEIDKSVGEEEVQDWAQPPDEEMLPNGLPVNYNSIVNNQARFSGGVQR